MATTQAAVEQSIRDFLVRIDKPVDALTPDLTLYAEGIGLDSIETAELSAVLEDEFGTDPFSGDTMPQTVGDIVAFYGSAAGAA